MFAATAPNKKEIRSALNKAGLSKVDNDVLSKCVALASTLHLRPETMAEVWEAYSLNKQNLTELTMHSFEAYKNELVKVSSVTPASEGIISSTKGAAMVSANKHKRDAALAAMVTPLSTAKRHQGNQHAADNKNDSSVDQVAIQGGAGSPNVAATKKPTIALPKYEERTKVGEVVVSYPSGKTSISKSSSPTDGRPRCVVSAQAEDESKGVGKYNITKPYRHMFTTLEDRAVALEKHLMDRKAAIIEQHGLSNTQQLSEDNHNNNDGSEDAKGVFAPLEEVNVPRQENITCIGRVCNEAHEGKLNATSVALEGSSVSCGGARINVDLSHMKTTTKSPYSLFPGQIVALEGMNGTGRKITAHRILEGAPPPRKMTSVRALRQFHYDADKQDGSPLKVITASGPFTTSQSMDYEPFIDLMHVVLEEAPDVVVLTGPFVDMRQSTVQSGNTKIDVADEGSDVPEEVVVSFEAVFAQKISGLIEEALMASDEDGEQGARLQTQFVLVPAMEDATAKWVYPQPPLQDQLPKGGKFLEIPGAEAFEFGSMGLYRLQEMGKGRDGMASCRVHCMSNPCTFQVNEVVFGVTSTDVLFHLSIEETNANLVPGSRLRHIAQHLVQQQSYYPLFPPSKSVNLDLKQSEGWRMPCRPDVLVIPSKLTPFCSTVLESTMAVNPGHLTKGTTGGTYAIMEIQPMSRDIFDDTADDVELPHNVPDRIQVEVKKI